MNTKELENLSKAELPEIRSMGPMLIDPIWALRDHVSRTCELLFLEDGKLELHIADTKLEAVAGDLLIIPSNTLHRDVFDFESSPRVFYCFFTWPKGAEYFNCIDNKVLLEVPIHRKSLLSSMISQLHMDSGEGDEISKLVARAKLMTILLSILREIVILRSAEDRSQSTCDDNGKRRYRLLREAKAYLNAHYNQCMSLEEIASAVGISSYYLSHIFSEETGFSLFEYLNALRMAKARMLLMQGKYNISEVAQQVGYDDANYFSKVFKKQYGRSPRECAQSDESQKNTKFH